MEHFSPSTARRHMAETKQNDRSSRSHCIMRIIIESRALQDETAVMVSHLNFVDLAGSEKAGENSGDRFREGCAINKSLFSLSQVISKLSDGVSHQHIGYRDSKLTRILQNALGGNSKTAIIATITPATIEESHSTLRFASRAKTISNKPQLNEVLSDAALLKRSQIEIKKLQEKIKQLECTDLHYEKEDLQKQLQEKKDAQAMHEELINQLKFIIVSGNNDSQPQIKKRRRETWCPGKGKGRRMSFLDHMNLANEGNELSVIAEISPPQFKKGKRSFDEFTSPDNAVLSSTLKLTGMEENFIQTRRSDHISFSPDAKTKELMALQDQHELLLNDYSRLKAEMEEQETFHNIERETLEDNIKCLSEELNFFKGSVPEIELKCQKNGEENEILKTQLSDLQVQLEQKTEQYQCAHKDMKEMEMNMNLLSDEVFQLQHKLEIQNRKLSDYQGELTEMRGQGKEESREDLRTGATDIDTNLKTIQVLKEEVELQKSKISDLENINEELKHHHETTEEMLRTKIQGLEMDVERLSTKMSHHEVTGSAKLDTSNENQSIVQRQSEEIKQLSLELERVKEEMTMKSEYDANQINMYKEEIETHEELIEKLTLELDGLTQQADNNRESENKLLKLQYEEKIQAQSEKISELTYHLQTLSSPERTGTSCKDHTDDGTDSVKQLQNECDSLQKDKADLNCVLAQLQDKMDQQIQKMKQEHDSQLNSLNEKISQQQQQLLMYEDDTTDIRTTDIKDILDAKLEMDARLNKQKTEHEKQIQTMSEKFETEKQEYLNRISEFEETVSSLQNEKSLLKDPNELMVEFQGILETVKSEHSLELKTLKEKHEAEMTVYKTTKTCLESANQLCGDTDDSSQRYVDEIAHLKNTLESQTLDFERKIKELEDTQDQKEQMMNRNEEISSQMMNENEDLRLKVCNLEESLKIKEELIEIGEESTKTEVESLKSEICDLKNDMLAKDNKIRCFEECSLTSEEMQEKCYQLQQEIYQLKKCNSELQNAQDKKENDDQIQQEDENMSTDLKSHTETVSNTVYKECLRCEMVQEEFKNVHEIKMEHEALQEKYDLLLQDCGSLRSEVERLQSRISQPVENDIEDTNVNQSYQNLKEENLKLEKEIQSLKSNENVIISQNGSEMQEAYQILNEENERLQKEIEILKNRELQGNDQTNTEIQEAYQIVKEEKETLEKEIELLKNLEPSANEQTNTDVLEAYQTLKEEKEILEKEIEILKNQEPLVHEQTNTEVLEAYQTLKEEKEILEKEIEILKNLEPSANEQTNTEVLEAYQTLKEEKEILEKEIEILKSQDNLGTSPTYTQDVYQKLEEEKVMLQKEIEILKQQTCPESGDTNVEMSEAYQALREEKVMLEKEIEILKSHETPMTNQTNKDILEAYQVLKEEKIMLEKEIEILKRRSSSPNDSCDSENIVESLKSENSRLESIIESGKVQFFSLKEKCESLEEQVFELHETNAELQESCQTQELLTGDIEHWKQECERLCQEIEILNSENQELKEKMSDEIDKLQKQSGELNNDKEVLQSNEAQLREQVDKLKEDICELEEFKSKCQTFEQSLKSMQNENERLVEDNRIHTTEKTELKSNKEKATKLCEKLTLETDDLKEMNEKLSIEKSKSTELIHHLEQKANMLEETVKEFQEESEKYLEEKKHLEDQLSNIQEKLSQYFSPDSVQREIGKERQLITSEYEEKITQYKQKVESLTSDIDRYKSECSNEKLSFMDQVKSQYEAELRTKSDNVIELRGEITEMRAKLFEADSRTSQVQQELDTAKVQFESLQSKAKHVASEYQTEVNELSQKYKKVNDELQQQIAVNATMRERQRCLADQTEKLQQKSNLYEETMKELQEESERKSLEQEKYSQQYEEEISRLKRKTDMCNAEIQKLQQIAQDYSNEVLSLKESEKKLKEAVTNTSHNQSKVDVDLRAENENLKQEIKKARQKLCDGLNNAKEKNQAIRKELGQKTMEYFTLKHQLEKTEENLQKSKKQYQETIEMHEKRITKLKNEIRRLQNEDNTFVEPMPCDLNPVQTNSCGTFSGAGGAVDHFANILLESEKKRLLKEVTALKIKLDQSQKELAVKSAETEKVVSQLKDMQDQSMRKSQTKQREPLEDTNYQEEKLTPICKIPSSVEKAPIKQKFHIPELDSPRGQYNIETDMPEQMKENCKVQ